jgi:hypothetical protein
MRIVALAGGIGGARFLRGLRHAVPDAELTVVVNTGDDLTLYGLRICPDLDTVMYTLGGGIDEERGWGRPPRRRRRRAAAVQPGRVDRHRAAGQGDPRGAGRQDRRRAVAGGRRRARARHGRRVPVRDRRRDDGRGRGAPLRSEGGLLDGWLVDVVDDGATVPGVEVRAVPLLMTDLEATAAMARAALDLAGA